MTTQDRHRTQMTQMRLRPETTEILKKAALEYDVPMNWIVNRALEAGLPRTIRLLAELHGKASS